MGRSTIIAILFAGNTNNIYFSGQVISGHVHVQNEEAIKMRGIRLEVSGRAYVEWTEGSDKHKTVYTGKEEFLNLSIDIMGSRSKDSEIHLQPGTHDLPFTFILAPDLPSSYEHIYGHIRYKAKAVIDRPLRFDDSAEVALTIVRSLDLNLEPFQLREPVVVQSQNPASGCCCVSGSPQIDLTLNKGLFIVGETILVQGEISNRTNSKIKYTTISLVQNTEFISIWSSGKIHKRMNEKKVLAKFDRPTIAKGCSDSWNNISFIVPPVLSSRLDGCSIINISYYVEVTAVFSECCSNSSARADVIIGNVPLASDFQTSVICSQPQSSFVSDGVPGSLAVHLPLDKVALSTF